MNGSGQKCSGLFYALGAGWYLGTPRLTRRARPGGTGGAILGAWWRHGQSFVQVVVVVVVQTF